MRVVHLYSSLVINKKSLNNIPWLLKSAECFYRTRNTQIQYIGDKCRVSIRFSVVGVHCHSLVLLPLTITKHINVCLQIVQISTCMGFAALAKADTKFSHSLCFIGMGAVSCARGEFIMSVGNLQEGERYVVFVFVVIDWKCWDTPRYTPIDFDFASAI